MNPKLTRELVDVSFQAAQPLKLIFTYTSRTIAATAFDFIKDLDPACEHLEIAVAALLYPNEIALVEMNTAVSHTWVDSPHRVLMDSAADAINLSHVRRVSPHLDGRGIVVAVLDSGVDVAHPDLQGRVVGQRIFVGDAISDVDGHGTHVAAIVAGSGAASSGLYKGVASGAKLLIGKVIGDDGVGFDSVLISSLYWSYNNGAKIINLSVGSDADYDYDSPLAYAIRDITSRDVILVASAGNTGPVPGSITSPANDPNVVCVGNMRDNRTLNNTSSRGPTADGRVKPDFVCPGTDVISAKSSVCQHPSIPGNASYTQLTGTSMAAPILSGVCALIAQKSPHFTSSEIIDTLRSSAKKLVDDYIADNDQGVGAIDAFYSINIEPNTTENSVVHLSHGLKHAVLGDYGLSSMMNYGVIDVYTGERPLEAHLAPTGIRVGSITKNGQPLFRGSPNAGLTLDRSIVGVLKDTGDWVLVPIGDGVASWWRWTWYQDDPGTDNPYYPRMDGVVGENLFLSNPVIRADMAPILIDSFYLAFLE